MAFLFDGKIRKNLNFAKTNWLSSYAFTAYGVKIGIRSDNPEVVAKVIGRLPEVIPTGYEEISFDEADFIFSVRWGNERGKKVLLYKNDEELSRVKIKDWKYDHLDSSIRMTIAEFAENFAFLHAGAVRYKDKAIIIPARSFSGKTTLVAEFASRGLEYYSDEYAVIDEKGYVHPYPKQLSMRGIINDHEQVDIDVEEYGGKKGNEPIKVGVVLVSKFIKGAKFSPKLMSSGEGIIECISNSVSIRQNPEFVLRVLGNIVNDAKVIKTNRTEAKRFADKFISYLETLGI